jgi:trigger factor
MNVSRQDIDALNSVLKVEVSPEDYASKVKATLDNYRKTAKIPGFRPGHVPAGLIQKQYGKGVLAEELNKLVNDALNTYIQSNNLSILGNPIPKEGSDVEGDFDKPSHFSFEYEIGFAPVIEIPLTSKSKFTYNKVKIDDTLLNTQIEDLRRRYGKLISVDEVGEKDMILAQFVELSGDGTIKEGGIMHSSTISMEFVEDKKVKKELAGKNIGDKVVVDPKKVSRGGKDTAAMLGIEEAALDQIADAFQMTINEIKRMELAELNTELFDRLFGPGNVADEKALKDRISNDLAGMFANDSDRMLTRDVYNELMEKTKVELPDAFLKRWIKLSNEKPLTDEQIEQEYPSYVNGLKWQLIQTNIFKTNEIKLENQEVIEFTKGLLVNNYAQYGIPAPEDKELTASALQVLGNKDEANRIYDMLAEQKLTNYFKTTVKLSEKELAYDDFVALAGQSN